MKQAFLAAICLSLCQCGGGNGGPSFAATGTGKPPAGLEFLPQQAVKGELFSSFRPKGNSSWKNNWAGRLDFSGVSWNDVRGATLISPDYVVMAAHFMRTVGSPVIFHDKSGKPHERTIAAVRTLNVGDIAIGKLNQPAPPEVKRYRFASAGDATPGKPVLVTDKSATVSVHQVGMVSGSVIQLAFINGLSPTYQHYLVTGDSGHPSFILKGGELFLVETHTGGGAGVGPFYGDPQVQAAIRTAMSEMGN